MAEVLIPFNPYKEQREIYLSPARYRVVRAGRRSGKTFMGLHDMAHHALANNGSGCICIEPTVRQSQQIAFHPMIELLPKVLITPGGIVRERGNFQIKLINGSTMYFRSAEARDQVLRGEHVDYLLLDEVDYFPDGLYLWQSVLRPAMIDTKARVLALSSPESEGGLISYFFDEWGNHHDGLAVQLTTRHNPTLDPEEIEEARRQMDDITYRREILGEAIGYSGLCISKFDEEVHVIPASEIPELDPDYKYVAGLDYGVTDPTCILYSFVDWDGHCFIHDEFYQPCETMTPIYNSLKEHQDPQPYLLYYDAAHPGVANEIRIRGLAVCEKLVKDVRPGIMRVNEWFADGRLHISDKCVNLIEDLKKYKWKVTKAGVKKDEPEHDHSHGVDACRYLVHSMALNAKSMKPRRRIPFHSVAQLEIETQDRENADRLLRLSGFRR